MNELTMPECNIGSMKEDYQPSIRQALEANKKNLEARLAKVNAGLSVLDAEPKMAEALETITKAIRA